MVSGFKSGVEKEGRARTSQGSIARPLNRLQKRLRPHLGGLETVYPLKFGMGKVFATGNRKFIGRFFKVAMRAVWEVKGFKEGKWIGESGLVRNGGIQTGMRKLCFFDKAMEVTDKVVAWFTVGGGR